MLLPAALEMTMLSLVSDKGERSNQSDWVLIKIMNDEEEAVVIRFS